MKSINQKMKSFAIKFLSIAMLSAFMVGCGNEAQTNDVAVEAESTVQEPVISNESATSSSSEDIWEGFDPFDYIEVSYVGKAPNACPVIDINSDDERFDQLFVTFDYNGSLCDGDVFKVHVLRDGIMAYEKEFVAEGIGKNPESETTEEATGSVSNEASAQESGVATEKEAEQKEEAKEETKSSNAASSDESYILLADGTKLYNGQSIKASEIAGAKFILQGVPQMNYWATSFLSWGPYYAAEDPEPNWAYDQTVDVGGEISLSWPASTLNDFSDTDYLFVGISSKDYSIEREWNFKIIR